MTTAPRSARPGVGDGGGPPRETGAPAALHGGRTVVVTVAVVAAGLVAAFVAARFSGALSQPPGGITDAGPIVRLMVPLVRVVSDVAAALTLGLLLLAATMVPGSTRAASAAPDEPRRALALKATTGAAFTWALAALVGVVLFFADAAGVPLSSPGFEQYFVGTVWSIETLRVGLLSALAAVVVASAAALVRSRAATVALTVVALLGILGLAPAGHAGGSADHETAVNALGAHLVGVSLWLGGLLALVVLRRAIGDSLAVVARRYSSLALWCYVVVGVSGVMSASTRLGGWQDLTTDYGLIVVAKVLAFIVLGAAGWWHRQHALARIEGGGGRGFVRLAIGETVVMGVAVGLAAALSRSAPPVPETEMDPSTALALTGFPAPPAPTALSWVTAWRVEWLFLAVGLLAIGLYLAGVVRLHRRGDRWPVLRTVTWVVGWLVFLYVTNGALGIYGRVAFSWHMTLHMIEAMVVPILLVLGAPVTLALRTLKPRRDGSLGPRELVLGLVHSRVLGVLGNPVVAAALFFASLVVFYWTGLFELALSTHTGHLLMTAHFVVTGYLFAWVLVGVDPGPKRWSPALRLIVLFATIAFHAFFGVAMITGTELLGGEFFTTIQIPWVPDLLADQRYGGGVAWAIGELPALVLALIVAMQWFRSDSAESVRTDRKADRDGDADLNAYNERLAALAGRQDSTEG
ncbi:MAG: Cytochrome c oxidase caa3-type, assembly factor CtaG-related protein [Humibacillus sp.]|nr:Cytochrome c oxidase caa3-type, assembly factor CtaG-related protein [Humibacillus sp.]